MKRCGFLGALAALVAAPSVLERVSPKSQPPVVPTTPVVTPDLTAFRGIGARHMVVRTEARGPIRTGDMLAMGPDGRVGRATGRDERVFGIAMAPSSDGTIDVLIHGNTMVP